MFSKFQEPRSTIQSILGEPSSLEELLQQIRQTRGRPTRCEDRPTRSFSEPIPTRDQFPIAESFSAAETTLATEEGYSQPGYTEDRGFEINLSVDGMIVYVRAALDGHGRSPDAAEYASNRIKDFLLELDCPIDNLGPLTDDFINYTLVPECQRFRCGTTLNVTFVIPALNKLIALTMGDSPTIVVDSNGNVLFRTIEEDVKQYLLEIAAEDARIASGEQQAPQMRRFRIVDGIYFEGKLMMSCSLGDNNAGWTHLCKCRYAEFDFPADENIAIITTTDGAFERIALPMITNPDGSLALDANGKCSLQYKFVNGRRMISGHWFCANTDEMLPALCRAISDALNPIGIEANSAEANSAEANSAPTNRPALAQQVIEAQVDYAAKKYAEQFDMLNPTCQEFLVRNFCHPRDFKRVFKRQYDNHLIYVLTLMSHQMPSVKRMPSV